MSDLISREDAARIAEDFNLDIWEYSTGNRSRIGHDPVAEAIRALPAVQPDAREAALQEAANGLRKAAEELDGYVGSGYGDEYLELANSLALIDRSAHD